MCFCWTFSAEGDNILTILKTNSFLTVAITLGPQIDIRGLHAPHNKCVVPDFLKEFTHPVLVMHYRWQCTALFPPGIKSATYQSPVSPSHPSHLKFVKSSRVRKVISRSQSHIEILKSSRDREVIVKFFAITLQ